MAELTQIERVQRKAEFNYQKRLEDRKRQQEFDDSLKAPVDASSEAPAKKGK